MRQNAGGDQACGPAQEFAAVKQQMFFPFMDTLNMAVSPHCFDIETLSVTVNYGARMTLANHFSRDGIGVRLRGRQARKDFTMSFFKKLFGGGGTSGRRKL